MSNFKTFKDFFMKLFKYTASLDIVHLSSSLDVRVIMSLCIIHIVISCSLHISFTRIIFVQSHVKIEDPVLCQEELKQLIFFLYFFFFFFCKHLLINKHKTKLADLSCQRQLALLCLDFQGIYTESLWSSCLLI